MGEEKERQQPQKYSIYERKNSTNKWLVMVLFVKPDRTEW